MNVSRRSCVNTTCDHPLTISRVPRAPYFRNLCLLNPTKTPRFCICLSIMGHKSSPSCNLMRDQRSIHLLNLKGGEDPVKTVLAYEKLNLGVTLRSVIYQIPSNPLNKVSYPKNLSFSKLVTCRFSLDLLNKRIWPSCLNFLNSTT